MSNFFEYGEIETNYLKSKDKKMAAAIERIGHIEREADEDLFSAVVHHIVGQQISTKAQRTIWLRMRETLGAVNAKTVIKAGEAGLQPLGISARKAGYILDFAKKVAKNEFDIDEVERMSDEDAIAALSSLKGVGVWTAEMILLFSMQRPDVFSFGDLAILRGLRMLYRHREITKKRFEMYRKRFTPYCSVASLYLWAVAGGALPELNDPALREQKIKK